MRIKQIKNLKQPISFVLVKQYSQVQIVQINHRELLLDAKETDKNCSKITSINYNFTTRSVTIMNKVQQSLQMQLSIFMKLHSVMRTNINLYLNLKKNCFKNYLIIWPPLRIMILNYRIHDFVNEGGFSLFILYVVLCCIV